MLEQLGEILIEVTRLTWKQLRPGEPGNMMRPSTVEGARLLPGRVVPMPERGSIPHMVDFGPAIIRHIPDSVLWYEQVEAELDVYAQFIFHHGSKGMQQCFLPDLES